MAVCERAARTLAQRVERHMQGTVVLLVMPRTAAHLDCSFSGEEREIVIGEVRAVGRHRSWSIIWNPATDEGRIHPNGTYDYRA